MDELLFCAIIYKVKKHLSALFEADIVFRKKTRCKERADKCS